MWNLSETAVVVTSINIPENREYFIVNVEDFQI
jgi:hypothetical protein